VRAPVIGRPGAAPSGRGEGVEVGQEPVADQVGDTDVDVCGAVTIAARGQRRTPRGPGLLLLQQTSLEALAHLGRDDVDDAAPQHPQRPRPEPGGLLQEPGLGRGAHTGTDLGGQGVQSAHDDLGLGEVHPALAQRRRRGLPLGQGPGQAELPAALVGVAAAVVGQPRRGVARALLGGDVGGGGQHPHPQLLHPIHDGAQPQERRRLLLGVHVHRIDLGDVAQRRADRGHRGEHGMQLDLGLRHTHLGIDGRPGTDTTRDYISTSMPARHTTSSGRAGGLLHR
jgi:hypothetical protein